MTQNSVPFTMPERMDEATGKKNLWEERVAGAIVKHDKDYSFEIAKMLLTHRIEAGREYSKTMLPVTLSAIAAYLVLLGAIWPRVPSSTQYERLVFWQSGVSFFPVFLFVIAATLYTACYFAQRHRDEDDPHITIVELVKKEVLVRRWTSVAAGIAMYLATVWGMIVAIVMLSSR